jgi:hypothetical protein
MVDLLAKWNPVYSTSNPPFDKLILTISFLVRSIPCIVDLNDASNFEKVDMSSDIDTMEQILEQKGKSPYHTPLTTSYDFYDTDIIP